MQRDEFKNWLVNIYKGIEGLEPSAADNRVSNTQKVEVALGDLDEHFKNDSLASIKEKLKYSKVDDNCNKPLPHGLEIDGDYYTGMATLRQAVKRYGEFKSSFDSCDEGFLTIDLGIVDDERAINVSQNNPKSVDRF